MDAKKLQVVLHAHFRSILKLQSVPLFGFSNHHSAHDHSGAAMNVKWLAASSINCEEIHPPQALQISFHGILMIVFSQDMIDKSLFFSVSNYWLLLQVYTTIKRNQEIFNYKENQKKFECHIPTHSVLASSMLLQ